MSSSEPVRQSTNDLVSFDISRQSPEQIAQLFARWKEQRKRLNAPVLQRTGRPPHLRPVPAVTRGAAQEAAETLEAATPPAPAEQGGPFRYSASFEALLTTREPSLAQRVWNPDAGLQTLGQPHPPRHRSGMKWVLAGAASVVAVAAVAGGTLWEQVRPERTQGAAKTTADTSLIASPAEAALPVTPAYPMDIPMAEPFVARAIASGEADWPLRQAVDLALMKTAPVVETARLPLMPQLKPPVPVVRTASKPLVSKTSPTPAPALEPAAEPIKPAIARVELPLVTSVTTATVSVPVAPAADARADDARPQGAGSRGNDKGNYTFGANGHTVSGKPAGAIGGSAKSGSGSSGGDGTGGNPGGGTGGGDPGGGTGGDAGGGDSGGGDSGGADNGGGDSGGGDSGGDSGGGDSGGDSDSGGSASRGGLGGAIGGALGGVGNALGGALGGGKDSANGGKDKDKDKGKDKGKEKAD